MPTPNEKLAESMAELERLQVGGRRAFRSHELSRVHRERLLHAGYLQQVVRGWLISSGPGSAQGESTPWFASFWEFCARYCEARFSKDWHLSPEQSLLISAENTVIPRQVIIYSPKGANNTTTLLFGTSLYDLKESQPPPSGDLIVKDGLRLFATEPALIKVPQAFFAAKPVEAHVALASVREPSALLRRLLDGGNSVVAGRLVGAFRRVGRADTAEEIRAAMTGAGYSVRESDPFVPGQEIGKLTLAAAPIVGRIQSMWGSMRGTVLSAFPPAPGLPADGTAYLHLVDEIYQSDAYHSLSIEGYRVTPDLIERVRSGNWRPESNQADQKSGDAPAARGYWQAFRIVKRAVEKIITGANPGTLVRSAHREWYRELFQPSVAAGLIPAAALAGYRNDFVFLRTSRYVPPRWEAVRDAMPALFDLLESEREPAVRAVLGHWLIGYIHPYMDGNGRIARFLMNAMLASGGYPWTVVRVEDRTRYLHALDRASIDLDIGPFAAFLAERVGWSVSQLPAQLPATNIG
ncbi:MAG TPA: Fic family protein [Steroidobacteraceae bacterium]|nr:Fic family protein [Steroidobacteraceae bacterium]